MTHVFHCPRAARLILAAAAGWLVVAGTSPAAYLILQGGNRVDGRGLRLNARGDYVIETASGSRTYPAAQVARAEADKPAGFDQAIAAANAGQYEKAVSGLTEVARRNRGLGWDDRAQAALAQIQISQGNFEEAVTAFEAMRGDSLVRSDLQAQYWQALLETNSFGKLGRLLDPAIRDGDRPLAARAQLIRGDLNRKQRLLEDAVLDYLRTVHFFNGVKEVQPEALYKAATTLEEMRHAKAKDMFDTLIKDYPQSDYARQAQDR